MTKPTDRPRRGPLVAPEATSASASPASTAQPLSRAQRPAVPTRAASPRPRAPGAARRAAKPVLPLALAIEEYVRDLRRRDISEKTIKDYAQVLRLASGFWHERLGRPPTLDDVTVRNGEALLDHLLQRGKIHWRRPEQPSGEPLARETLRTYVRAHAQGLRGLADRASPGLHRGGPAQTAGDAAPGPYL